MSAKVCAKVGCECSYSGMLVCWWKQLHEFVGVLSVCVCMGGDDVRVIVLEGGRERLISKYPRACVNACMHARTNTTIHTYIHTYINTHMPYVCTYIHKYIITIHTYIHTYMHK